LYRTRKHLKQSTVIVSLGKQKMPRKGYKSITVTDEVDELIRTRYEKNRDFYLRRYNITSFSGYLLFLTQLEDKQAEKDTH
jgi:hypothetical protein